MAQAARVEKKSWIPEISDKRISELCERIKPVMWVMFDQRGLCYIKPPNKLPGEVAMRRTHPFMFDPKPTEKAAEIKKLCDIMIYTRFEHGFPSIGFPSIAEVLAQIPAEHLGKVVAFRSVSRPETETARNAETEAFSAGYHTAWVQLYIRE